MRPETFVKKLIAPTPSPAPSPASQKVANKAKSLQSPPKLPEGLMKPKELAQSLSRKASLPAITSPSAKRKIDQTDDAGRSTAAAATSDPRLNKKARISPTNSANSIDPTVIASARPSTADGAATAPLQLPSQPAKVLVPPEKGNYTRPEKRAKLSCTHDFLQMRTCLMLQ